MKDGKRALAILSIAAAISAFGPGAHAGHGPVTDVLLQQNVFLPSEPQVCPQLADALNELTDRMAKKGYPVKVAIISSQADLGVAPQYFGRPQDYARLLGREIGIYRPGLAGAQTTESLLTVMPAGFGYVRSGKAKNVLFVILGLEAPDGDHPNDLARATIDALPELASAAGHPVSAPKIGSGCSDGGGIPSAIVYVVPIALTLLAAAFIYLVRRRRAS